VVVGAAVATSSSLGSSFKAAEGLTLRERLMKEERKLDFSLVGEVVVSEAGAGAAATASAGTAAVSPGTVGFSVTGMMTSEAGSVVAVSGRTGGFSDTGAAASTSFCSFSLDGLFRPPMLNLPKMLWRLAGLGRSSSAAATAGVSSTRKLLAGTHKSDK
jgi:hypothetical protein